jgi:hypothetical protein
VLGLLAVLMIGLLAARAWETRPGRIESTESRED